jgi:hypothetical protein
MSDRFMEVYNHHEVSEIAYNPDWANGTGYFDRAVYGDHAPVIENGKVVKSVDEDGRKILIIGFSLGNVVVFERYAAKKEAEPVYVLNQPQSLARVLPKGRLDDDTLCQIFGEYGAPKYNIVNELIAISEELKAN